MALEMRAACEKCDARLGPEAEAYICSYECTFCPACTTAMATTKKPPARVFRTFFDISANHRRIASMPSIYARPALRRVGNRRRLPLDSPET